jgi:hydroxymethylbilane synthase
LAQAHQVLDRCRAAFPDLAFDIRIIKTTGDRLQRASMAQTGGALPKGLFTKELETALLDGTADLAVHSLKDLPTDVPAGLTLTAVLEREDPRDVLVCRQVADTTRAADSQGPPSVESLPRGATVATSSTRRREQLLALRPDLSAIEIRGNVGTRLQKLADHPDLAATLLAAAGLRRLGYRLHPDGRLEGPVNQAVPPGLVATLLPIDTMIPCVGQAAIGLEIRSADGRLASICGSLNHPETFSCVTAERAFLHHMGGGCQSPVAAYAVVVSGKLEIRGVSFRTGRPVRATLRAPAAEARQLGEQLAAALLECADRQ